MDIIPETVITMDNQDRTYCICIPVGCFHIQITNGELKQVLDGDYSPIENLKNLILKNRSFFDKFLKED